MPTTRTSSSPSKMRAMASSDSGVKVKKSKSKGKGKGKAAATGSTSTNRGRASSSTQSQSQTRHEFDENQNPTQLTQKDAMQLAKDIVSSLEPSSSDFSIPKLSSSLLKRANAPLTRRRSSHNPNSLIHTSPSKQTRDDLKREDLTLDWNKFRNWPDGVMEEREARGEYFRRLKFIHLEQRSKSSFLEDCNEDSEIGKDAVVHSSSDVAQMEKEKDASKQALKLRKAKAYSHLSSISSISSSLLNPYLEFKSDALEASKLLDSINEKENELRKLRSMRGLPEGIWDEHKFSEEAGIGPERVVPRKGTMTLDEADQFMLLQVQDMQNITEAHEILKQRISNARLEINSYTKSVDKLEMDKAHWDRKAKEVMEIEDGATKDGGKLKRDKAVERECNTLTFSLNIMKQLLSVTNLTAISPKEFHTTYRLERSSNDGMDIDQEASEVEEELDESTSGFSTIRSRNRNRDLTVALRFDQPGGKLVGYSLLLPAFPGDPHSRLLPHPLIPSPHEPDAAHARLEAAVKANDPCLLLKEAVGCIERRLR